jgi:hypothetical protein
VLTIVLAGTGLAQVSWQKTFGGDSTDVANAVLATADSGCIFAGYTNSFGAGGLDYYVGKVDARGNLQWSATYGGPGNDYGYAIAQCRDGGFVIAGLTGSFGAGGGDFYVVRIDKLGDTIWTRTYGGTALDVAYSVQQTFDGGFIVAGYTNSFGAGDQDVYLVKTDSAGDTLWTHTYGGSKQDFGYSVQQTSDSGYIITGSTYSFGNGGAAVYLIKTDALGDTLWTRTYGGALDDGGQSVEQTRDGGYIVAGYESSFTDGFYAFYLIKTDETGDTLWTRMYGTNKRSWCYSVRQTTDGGYILAGQTEQGHGGEDVYLVLTDSDGNPRWANTFGGVSDDVGYSVCQTLDGGFVVAGYTYSFGKGDSFPYVYLVKADTELNVGVAGNPQARIRRDPSFCISATPSVFGERVTLRCVLPRAAQPARIEVRNAAGREVRAVSLPPTGIESTAQWTWDGADARGRRLPPGCYFCTLRSGPRSDCVKMLRVQ